MKKTNAYSKSTELNAVLSDFFQGTINKARLRLILHFICALCKVQTVTFSKLANGFDRTSKAESSLRRIQRFISGYTLDRDLYHFSYEFTVKENPLFFNICDREKSSIAALRFIFIWKQIGKKNILLQ